MENRINLVLTFRARTAKGAKDFWETRLTGHRVVWQAHPLSRAFPIPVNAVESLSDKLLRFGLSLTSSILPASGWSQLPQLTSDLRVKVGCPSRKMGYI